MYGLTTPIFVKENITQDIERRPNPMLSTKKERKKHTL